MADTTIHDRATGEQVGPKLTLRQAFTKAMNLRMIDGHDVEIRTHKR